MSGWNTKRVDVLPDNPSSLTLYQLPNGTIWMPKHAYHGKGCSNYSPIYPLEWEDFDKMIDEIE